MLKTFDYNKMPVVEVVNEIMVDSAKRGASDIHFDPLENFMKIRIRIDGNLIDYALVPNDIKKNLITRVKIISGMNITESRLPQDGAIKATLQGISLDLRVSTIPTNMGEKIVIRILDYSLSGAGIEKLGFSDKNYAKVIEMINQPNGIILVTGATGTGKSTTVYSILQRLNKETTNIVTVEDPVEMNIEGVNQIQANSEIGLDFATALRSILRQDPNIIMIGEIRDTETAKIAIRASITGHLVLSTLHTNDSLNTIERLLDMDVERYLLASSLTGIIAQKLARRLCPHCRKEVKVNTFEAKLFETLLGHKVKKVYVPVGCDKCHNGYKGRIAIQEVLLINQQIRDAISMNYRKDKLRNLVYNGDVDSLLQDGLRKVEAGYTSMEELLKLIELENEDSSIAKMGIEASLKLAQEIEDQKVEEEIKEEKKKDTEKTEILIDEPKEEKKKNIEKTEILIDEPKEENNELINFDEVNKEVENNQKEETTEEINEDKKEEKVETKEDTKEETTEEIIEPTSNETNDITLADIFSDNDNEVLETNNDTKTEEVIEEPKVEINNNDNNIIDFNDLNNEIINENQNNSSLDEQISDLNDEGNISFETDINDEPVIEEKPEEKPEEKEEKFLGLFKKKKKKNKEIEEKETKEDIKEDTKEEIKFDDTTDNIDLSPIDDIKPIENKDNNEIGNLDLNELSLGDIKSTDNINDNNIFINDDELNNIFNGSEKNDDYSFLNSFDNIESDENKKKYDFSDAKREDLIFNDYGPKHEDTIDLSTLNFDVDEPTIDLKNVKVSPDSLFTDDIKDGTLDNDLSNASDDEIMDLFD